MSERTEMWLLLRETTMQAYYVPLIRTSHRQQCTSVFGRAESGTCIPSFYGPASEYLELYRRNGLSDRASLKQNGSTVYKVRST
jgi:hypothetical protein